MNEEVTLTNEVICPVCGRPMTLLHTIRRAFGENLNVFKCKSCGFSMTEPVSKDHPTISGLRRLGFAGREPATSSLDTATKIRMS
jgi:predicted RNA-binding Zn-ribbon protein involved in translation (DUF1610 family)